MQPREVVDTTVGELSKEDNVMAMIEDLLDKLPEQFNIQELMSKVSERAVRWSCRLRQTEIPPSTSIFRHLRHTKSPLVL